MHNFPTLAALFLAAAAFLGAPTAAAQSVAPEPVRSTSPIRIPEVLRIEQEQLQRDLSKAKEAGGHTADVAREVEAALKGHFEAGNRLVMPLLGLLVPLAQGRVTEAMRPAVWMAEQVRAELPQFLEAHRRINEAVNRLISVAGREKKPEVARFGQRLAVHAQYEQVVLYPAAILVGERVKDALAESAAATK